MTDQTHYVSVTSITGLLPKELTWWAANAAADCAVYQKDEWAGFTTDQERYEYIRRAHQRIKDKAAGLGSQVHKHVEAVNLGKPAPVHPLPVRPRMAAFQRFLDDYQPRVEAAEVRVYSRTHGYAGTADMLAELDGRMAVLDIKTSRSIWPESALQVAAYARADFLIADPHHPGARQENKRGMKRYYTWNGPEEDEIPLPDVEDGYVLHLRDDGYTLHRVTDMDEAHRMFVALLPVDRWERDVKKRILAEVVDEDVAARAIAEFGDAA